MVTAGRYPRQLILYFILGHLRRLARLQADQPPVFAAALDHAIIVGPDRGPKTVPAVHVRANLVLVVPQVLGNPCWLSAEPGEARRSSTNPRHITWASLAYPEPPSTPALSVTRFRSLESGREKASGSSTAMGIESRNKPINVRPTYDQGPNVFFWTGGGCAAMSGACADGHDNPKLVRR